MSSIGDIALGIVLLGAPQAAAPAPQPMTSFSGGTFEASGVAHVAGTDSVLFVDDGRQSGCRSAAPAFGVSSTTNHAKRSF